jgi:predicted nucleic acid-binding protein
MATVFLLDTSVISAASWKYPDPNVQRFLAKAEDIRLPAGALMEMQLGITKMCAISPLKAVKLSAWYHELTSGIIPIVDTDRDVIEVWGTLAADPRLLNLTVPRAGTRKVRGGQDLHIAAAALVHRAVIATLNVKDFMLINSCYPLPGVYNPMDDTWHTRMEPLVAPDTVRV